MTTQTPTPPPDPSPAVDARAAMATLLARREDFLNFLARRTGDRALAEDLLQEAFARASSQRPSSTRPMIQTADSK